MVQHVPGSQDMPSYQRHKPEIEISSRTSTHESTGVCSQTGSLRCASAWRAPAGSETRRRSAMAMRLASGPFIVCSNTDECDNSDSQGTAIIPYVGSLLEMGHGAD